MLVHRFEAYLPTPNTSSSVLAVAAQACSQRARLPDHPKQKRDGESTEKTRTSEADCPALQSWPQQFPLRSRFCSSSTRVKRFRTLAIFIPVSPLKPKMGPGAKKPSRRMQSGSFSFNPL
jgi:hypothetical protein